MEGKVLGKSSERSDFLFITTITARGYPTVVTTLLSLFRFEVEEEVEVEEIEEEEVMNHS